MKITKNILDYKITVKEFLITDIRQHQESFFFSAASTVLLTKSIDLILQDQPSFSAMAAKPAILFISEPNRESNIYKTAIKKNFQIFHHQFGSKDPESFLQYLNDTFDEDKAPLTAIYGGYPCFMPIGGLTRKILEHEYFPANTLRCITVCSRGINGIDLEALSEFDIKLFNYNDDSKNCSSNPELVMKQDLVGNDVADCALWHVMEGFRKFSYQQQSLREHPNTLTSRFLLTGKDLQVPQFAFGHELSKCMVKSPRGQKVLILGLGAIGKQIGHKLHHGLGMEVHYTKRAPDTTVTWRFHDFNDSLFDELKQFSTIIVALPGTSETRHLVDDKFLSHCSEELILVNIGRGFILDQVAVDKALRENRLRHLGIDVFYNEPDVSRTLVEAEASVTITPHIASSTEDVFNQSCDVALNNIIKTVLGPQMKQDCN